MTPWLEIPVAAGSRHTRFKVCLQKLLHHLRKPVEASCTNWRLLHSIALEPCGLTKHAQRCPLFCRSAQSAFAPSCEICRFHGKICHSCDLFLREVVLRLLDYISSTCANGCVRRFTVNATHSHHFPYTNRSLLGLGLRSKSSQSPARTIWRITSKFGHLRLASGVRETTE